MVKNFNEITIEVAKAILQEHYGLTGDLSVLPGELDKNYRVYSSNRQYVLKISRPNIDFDEVYFPYEILRFIHKKNSELKAPEYVENKKGEPIGKCQTLSGDTFFICLISWIDGLVWAKLSYHSEKLLCSLGEEAGKITNSLQNFKSEFAHRNLDWDINQTFWTEEFQFNFQGEEKDLITHFFSCFKEIEPQLKKCRKSVVHNDANDYNVLVSGRYFDEVEAIIDYGDAVYTSTINDLAICLTYAIMGKPDPVEVAFPVIQGYNSIFSLLEEELEILYWLVGARLVISLTKSNINTRKEPGNKYLTISEKPGWELIKKWKEIGAEKATAFFRKAAGFPAHKNSEKLSVYLETYNLSVGNLFDESIKKPIIHIDLDITSTNITCFSTFKHRAKFTSSIKQIWEENNQSLMFGGYQEVRPEYIIEEYKKETNNGSTWENVLLGTQFWLFTNCTIKTLFPGKVIFTDDKMVFMVHEIDEDFTFYTIYRNIQPFKNLQLEQKIESGIGTFFSEQLGGYHPLFFQISLINPLEAFLTGSCTYQERSVFTDLYPSPELLFAETHISAKKNVTDKDLIAFRKDHLGKSLSLSYQEPLKMIRGDGVYLIDRTGRRYLDMVNNVAHVGHEHPAVVKAGQQQMAMLNTNSRYLHDNINIFAENLLTTLPAELSVVHFVNSGSEANELAIRMSKAFTGQKDFVAVEVGYHGNSNACIDISSYKFDGKGGSGAPEHTHIVPLPDKFRGKYTGSDHGMKYVDHVQDQIEKIQEQGRGPAAFICESIISCGGQIELPTGYLKEAYSYMRKAGGLCIADEVQVGCGRVGTAFWGFQLHGVIPDIVTIGKPIGNGHPLAAVVCTQKVAKSFANGMEYFNTFGGNPASCAIGNQVLEVIKNENLQRNALINGNYLKMELKSLQKQFPIIGDVRGQGLFLGFELTDTHKNPLSDKADYLVNRMKDLGILMSSDGPDHNVLKLKPPIVFNRGHAEFFMEKLKIVLVEEFMKI